MERNVVLKTEQLFFAYGDGPPLLQDITLEFREGAFVFIHGASGCGKSTFLKLLNRLEEPLSGEIQFKGQPLPSLQPMELRRAMTYIHQTPVLIDGTVKDNLLLPYRFKANRHLPVPEDAALNSQLERFRLDSVRLTDNAHNLSVGQRQRLCLLRAILIAPEVLLLDEPTSALDPDSRKAVEEMIETLNCDLQLTVFMVSHQSFTPRRVEPRYLEIEKGRIHQRS